MDIPKEVQVEREMWLFNKANWKAINKELADTNWDELLFLGPEPLSNLADEAVRRFTDNVLAVARKHMGGVMLVTLDGGVVDPGGAMTGGHIQKSKGKVSFGKKEISSFEKKEEELNKAEEAAQDVSD